MGDKSFFCLFIAQVWGRQNSLIAPNRCEHLTLQSVFHCCEVLLSLVTMEFFYVVNTFTGILMCVAAHSCYVCIDCENNSGSLQDCTNIAKSYNSLNKSLGALTGASSSSGPSSTCITLTMGGIGKLLGIFGEGITRSRLLSWLYLPYRRKFSLEFEFCYFANGKFVKFKSGLLFYFKKSLNDSLYNWNSEFRIRYYLVLRIWPIWARSCVG